SGLCKLSWLDAQCELLWQHHPESMQMQCQLQSFSDKRLPNIVVRNNVLSAFGQKIMYDVTVTGEGDIWRLLGRDEGGNERLLRVQADGEVLVCHFDNLPAMDVTIPFKDILALPHDLSDLAIKKVNLSGSSYRWRQDGFHSGELQITWNENAMSGQWQSSFQGIAVQNVVLHTPSFELRSKVFTVAQKKINSPSAELTLKNPSKWKSLYELLNLPMLDVEISSEGFLIHDSGDKANNLSLSETSYGLFLTRSDVQVLNILSTLDVFTAGELSGLRLSNLNIPTKTGRYQNIGTMQMHDVQMLWPFPGYVIDEALCNILLTDSTRIYTLHHDQVLWFVEESAMGFDVYVYQTFFPFAPGIPVPHVNNPHWFIKKETLVEKE
ncbi:MAG: hypothetical protein HRU15_02005, partial [Planctomycetes bacterium]|nr:hypothetical protein [Planctomycetota bacterium]